MTHSRTKTAFRSLYTIGGLAALLQVVTLIAMIVAMASLGEKPTRVEDYFTIQQRSEWEAVLRGDFLTLILIGLYLGTFPALYATLRHVSPIYSTLATLFTLIAVTLAFGSESTFSLLHLGDQYAAATTAAERSQFLAAGKAIVAADLWHNSGMYIAGILLQGSGVMISVIMLRSNGFSKITAYAGLIGNALDLFQHVLHPVAPSLQQSLTPIMGIFYLTWYPMMARDLLRLARGRSSDKTQGNIA